MFVYSLVGSRDYSVNVRIRVYMKLSQQVLEVKRFIDMALALVVSDGIEISPHRVQHCG